jgi:hypothetical protein
MKMAEWGTSLIEEVGSQIAEVNLFGLTALEPEALTSFCNLTSDFSNAPLT